MPDFGFNSAQDFRNANDSLGIPQFQTDKTYFLVQNGIITQGGVTALLSTGTHTISLVAPFTQQILAIHLQVIDSAAHIMVNSAGTNLEQISITLTGHASAFYWSAIGV